MKVLALDLVQFRAVLGSGEEKFCAKVLRAIPPAAETLGLVREWKRAVTGLVIGDAGAAMSERGLFDRGLQADRALSLAFASLIEGFATGGLGGALAGPVPGDLVARPLLGLEADGVVVRWGGLSREELRSLGAHPLLAPIAQRNLDAVGLWTDGKPASSSG